MLDPALLPAFFALFGHVGGDLLRRAAEKHVESCFGKALEKLGGLGRKSALAEAMDGALERASGAWIEAILKNLQGLGYDADDLERYKTSFAHLLEDEAVGGELARTLVDGEEWQGPDPRLFEDAWARLGGAPLPAEFRWPIGLAAFERQVRKQRLLTPELREVLNAANLVAIREELSRLGGTRPEGNERRYAERMREKYRVLDLAAFAPAGEEELLPPRLQDLFLPQDVRENPPPIELPLDIRHRLADSGAEKDQAADGGWPLPEEVARARLERVRSIYVEQPRLPVLEALAEPASRRSVLLGDPGSGKSTLAKYLLLSLLDTAQAPRVAGAGSWLRAFTGHLSLLIELREFIAERSRDRCATFLEFLDLLGKTQGYALEETWLARRLRGGPSLVLLDGLDEIFDAGERERVLHQIAGFCADYPQAAVVVTSRPAGYADTILRAAGFRHFALQELDDAQVERFVRAWFALTFPGRPAEAASRIARVLEAYARSRSIRLLAGNPLLLTIMVMIARQRELPRERVRFYEFSAEVLCHHWDVNRHLEQAGVELDYLDLEDKKELLRRIAFRMQAAPHGLSGNFLPGEDLRDELRAFLARDGKKSPAEIRQITRALIDQLRSRNYILCLYAPDLYGFVHRTFLEYFCADELRRRVHEDPTYSIETLLTEQVARHWQDPAWDEVIRLLCGTIGEAHAGRIIEYLTNAANPYWRADPALRPPRHLVLATHCLAEVRRRHAIAPVCAALLRAIVSTLEDADLTAASYIPLEELREALDEVGSDWPGHEWFHQGFPAAIEFVHPQLREIYLSLAVSLLGPDARLRPEIEGLLRRRSASTRTAALEVLARTWPREPSVRELVEQRALQEADHFIRGRALEALARNWPQEQSAREFIEQRALQDRNGNVRLRGLEALARTWPQEQSVRKLLEWRALKDQDGAVRGRALEALARAWPQEPSVREFAKQRALQDRDSLVRGRALEALARTWPQERSVRDLVEQYAFQDGDPARAVALEALAQNWPQEQSVRDLLERRALRDENRSVRAAALVMLARAWPNERSVRELVEQRAIQDEERSVRATALEVLARTWPQERSVRELVEQRAIRDEDATVRGRALRALARSWLQEQSVRELVEQRAIRDEDGTVRDRALTALARTWPQEQSVRELVEQRALQDQDSNVRAAAMGELVRIWPQVPATQDLIRRALLDGNPLVRCAALGGVLQIATDRAARLILSRDLDGLSPFLDPRKPISLSHRKNAASQLAITTSEVDERLSSYSKVLGWNLRKGLGEHGARGSRRQTS